MDNLEKEPWWRYLDEDLQELMNTSLLLSQKVGDWEEKFHDYSFVVFPASKAYEGFLKKLFLDMGFISKEVYFGKRFRIGKALNPSLEKRFRKESIYDKLVRFSENSILADYLWETWKNCRNLLFHWFPDERKVISFPEAKRCVDRIIESMSKAYSECIKKSQ